MYHNILCAVDTSPESVDILDKASALAAQHNAKLSIIHAIEYSILPKDYQKKLKAEVLPKLNALADQYKIPKKRRFIKFGQAYTNICELADKQSIDLIVLGSHGKHGIRTILGATANGVMHQTSCDALLVRMK